jgi:hypothetical protein
MATKIKHLHASRHSLAEAIANELFELGDELNSPTQRIEFKGGSYTTGERSQGGMCKEAMTSWLAEALDRHAVKSPVRSKR